MPGPVRRLAHVVHGLPPEGGVLGVANPHHAW